LAEKRSNLPNEVLFSKVRLFSSKGHNFRNIEVVTAVQRAFIFSEYHLKQMRIRRDMKV